MRKGGAGGGNLGTVQDELKYKLNIIIFLIIKSY